MRLLHGFTPALLTLLFTSTLHAAPRAPSDLRATDITTDSATLHWTDNSNAETAFYISRLDEGEDINNFAHWDRVATAAANATSLRVQGLRPGTRYWFRVRAGNDAGLSGFSNTVDFRTQALPPPIPPTNLLATVVNSTTVDLTWNDNSNNESAFHVSRLDEGEDPDNFAQWDRIAVTAPNATSFRVSGLLAGPLYRFRVRAVNDAGPSGFSNIVSVRTLTAPIPPANLQVTVVNSTTVDLTWNDNSNNESAFHVSRLDEGEDPDNFAQWDRIAVTAPNATSFRVSGLLAGPLYRFRVRAVNDAGPSGFSNIVSVRTPTAPIPPTNLQVTVVNCTTIDLIWTDNSNNEAAFHVSRLDEGEDPDNFAQWDRIAATAPNVTSLRVPGLLPGPLYRFRVRAVNDAGFSPFSNVVSVRLDCSPKLLVASDVTSNAVTLSWADNCCIEDHYNVSRLDEGEDPNDFSLWDRVARTDANVTSVRITGLLPDHNYRFRVRATFGDEFSGFSNIAAVSTSSCSPTGLTYSDVTADGVTLSWTDNCAIEDHYNVSRLDEGEDPNDFSLWDRVARTDANVTSVRITGLLPDHNYRFRVRATFGDEFSGFSNIAAVSTLSCSPTGLTYSDVTADGVTLSWTDNCAIEDHYNVSRLDAGEDPNDFSLWDRVARTDPNVTSVRISGLLPHTTYLFRVRAAFGERFSEFSNIVSVETGAAAPQPPQLFVRGDTNSDGKLSIADAVTVLGYLFLGTPSSLPCRATADADGNATIGLSDAIHILRFLFIGGPPPSAPFPSCGADPLGAAGLGCQVYPGCPNPPEPPHCDDDSPTPVDPGFVPTPTVQATGSLSSTISVGSSGEAACVIPIAVPPGTAGMEPRLSLAYNSRSGNGLLGVGWTLSGIPSITRRAATRLLDGLDDPVDFRFDDRFALDGQRLIAVSGEYGTDGTEYRTELETFSRVISHGQSGEGPSSFTVFSKGGQILEFGTTEDSRIEAQGQATVAVWALTKISDRMGNYLEFTYTEDSQRGEYYPSRIRYTGNRSAGTEPFAEVALNYESRPDLNLFYHAGSRSRQTVRLASIQTFVHSSLIHTYLLSYELSDATQRSRLTSVTLVAPDGTHFPPTRFDWRDNSQRGRFSIRPRFNPANYDLSANNYRYIPADVNGDGYADLVHLYGPRGVRVLTSHGDGSFDIGPLFPDSGYNVAANNYRFLSGDFDGDGQGDLVHLVNSNYLHVWLARRGGVTFSIRPAFPNDGYDLARNNYDFHTGDFNGDGRTDLLHLIGPSALRIWTSNGDGTFTISDRITAPYDISYNDYNVRVVDIDGDGRSDVLHFANDNFVRVWRSNGDRFRFLSRFPADDSYRVSDNAYAFTTGDFNGDGKTDLIHFVNRDFLRVWLSKGDGTFDIRRRDSEPGYALSDNNYAFQLGDFNGDHKTDLIHYADPDAVRVWTSIGNGSFIVEERFPGNGYRVDANAYRFLPGNFGSDSKQDLIHFVSSSYLHVWNSAGRLPDLLTDVVDGHGLAHEIAYRPLTNTEIYTKDSDASYPTTDIQGPLYVVAELQVDDGIGGKARSTYTYGGAKSDRDRGFLGFRWQRSVDERTGLHQYNEFRQDYPHIGSLSRSETTLSDGRLLSRSANSWDHVSTYDSRISFPFVEESTVETFELDGSPVSVITTRSEYDDFGNPVRVAVTSGDGHTQTTLSDYSNDTACWHIGKLLRAEVRSTAPDASELRKASSFAYHAETGLLVSETVEPGSAIALTTSYARDAFGNVTTTTVSGGGETRRAEARFDSLGRFPIETRNALGHTVTSLYDQRFGLPVERRDPNGVPIRWDHDCFGRTVLELRADGTTTTQSYHSPDEHAPPLAVYQVDQISLGEPPVATYIDVLGRPVRVRSIAFDSRNVFVDTEYDERGLLSRQSRRYLEGDPVYWSTTSYDAIGRSILVRLADGAESRTEYQGLVTTTINPLGQRLVTRKNSQGWLLSGTDNAGNTVTHRYDSLGRLIATRDVSGNEIRVAYDARDRRTLLEDPDSGRTEYRYNAFDELTWQRDAKGQVVTMEYDLLGRIVRRVEPEGTTLYAYDSADFGLGKLSAVSSPGGYERIHAYDELSRPAATLTRFDGLEHEFHFEYDEFSRLARIEYPTGFAATNLYTDLGYLDQVRSDTTGTTLWRAREVDAHGQVIHATLGNGLDTLRTFDPARGWLLGVQTSNQAHSVQDNSYSFDFVGNLTARSNFITGLSETFRYDGLNRLTAATAHGQTTKTFTYDALGNIRTKTGVGTYTYGGPRPHAVTSVSSIPGVYSYDPNGNMVSGAGRTIEYSSFNKPTRVDRGSTSSAFAYDAEHNRLKHALQSDGEITETTYIGKLYERVLKAGSVTHRHLVQAGGSVVAIYSVEEGSTPKWRYLHKDHLGSIESISDERGQAVEEFSYDPHGKPRALDGSDQASGTRSSEVTELGFGAHLQLDALDLIHMGGRAYDPLLGRFTTPDPFVQSMVSTQALNRYSYVFNNPLSYVDPSGYFSFGGFVGDLFESATDAIDDGFDALGDVAGDVGHAIEDNALQIVAVGAAAAVTALGGGPVLGGMVHGLISSKGDWEAAAFGAAQGLAFYGAGTLGELTNSTVGVLAHGVVGGVGAEIQGGDFVQGFASAALAKSLAGQVDARITGNDLGAVAGRVVASSALGGIGSKITGGSFASGAVTGAFSRLFNDELHGESAQEDHFLDTVQGVLDFAGFVPFVGDTLDVINGGIYALRGDFTNAGFALAAAVPFVGSTSTATKWGLRLGSAASSGTAVARHLGRAGEAAAGIVKNTERIVSATGSAAYRVPDVLNHSSKVIGEVKNVASLSYTSQLRDFASYSAQNGYTFELTTRSTTRLSGPLQQAVATGDIVLRTLP